MLKKTDSPALVPAKKKEQPLDEMTKMMKDLKLSQAEVQKKMNEELAYLKSIFTKNPPTPQQAAPYYSLREHGNREYPIANQGTSRIRGCYWDE